MSNAWLARAEVLKELGGISRETLRRLILAGELPQGTRCGKLCRRWKRETIENFLKRREAEVEHG